MVLLVVAALASVLKGEVHARPGACSQGPLTLQLLWSETGAVAFHADLLSLHTSAYRLFLHRGPLPGLSCHHGELHM